MITDDQMRKILAKGYHRYHVSAARLERQGRTMDAMFRRFQGMVLVWVIAAKYDELAHGVDRDIKHSWWVEESKPSIENKTQRRDVISAAFADVLGILEIAIKFVLKPKDLRFDILSSWWDV